jgi:voltage-gated potassium channel Kch
MMPPAFANEQLLKSAARGSRATVWGILASSILAAVKIIGGILGNSYALIAESIGSGESAATPSDAILIIGFGPAGQRVAEGLIDPHQGRIVVVDLNPDNISIANRYGLRGILGDATQTEIL